MEEYKVSMTGAMRSHPLNVLVGHFGRRRTTETRRISYTHTACPERQQVVRPAGTPEIDDNKNKR